MKSRKLTGIPTLGKMIGVFLTGTLMLVAVVGCSNLDYRLMEACRIDHSTWEYEDYGACQRMRETVAEEKASEQEWQEQLDAEDAQRAYQLEQAAANSPDAIQRRREANAILSSDALASWNLERQLADTEENGVNLRKYPDIARLSGIWCWGSDGFNRNEILDDGRIRIVTFNRALDPTRFEEETFSVRRDDGLIILTPASNPRFFDEKINMWRDDSYYHYPARGSSLVSHNRCE